MVSGNIPSGVDANCTLRHYSQIKKIVLRDIMVVGLHNSQCTGAYESRTARDTTTRRYITIQENLHTSRHKRTICILLTQELQGTQEPRLEVVNPLMLLRVDFNVRVTRHDELAGRELLRVDIGNLYNRVGASRRDDLYSNDHVHAYCCREDIIQVVVDVLTNDVHATGTASHEIGTMTVNLGELRDQVVEPRLMVRRN